MCGIAGILELSGGEASAERLKAMVASLVHRGPDDEGEWFNGPIALGHRRLSIIDLATGHQPMHNDDGSLVLIFNGEIYNYVELKQELQSCGYSFKTSSDTEVILQAYRHWGADCQRHFNGMWAFALWDQRARRLLLSRDRTGEKPLHYAVWNNTLLFGSEIKALHAGGLPIESRPELLEIYLTLGYIPAPHSFYKHVSKLRPGHYLLVEDGRLSELEYWRLPEIDEEDMRSDADNVGAEFASLLDDSVRIRMRSDVPFGAFLSGGLDSSTVVALMTGHSHQPVETFTIGFGDKEFDERPLARQVADAFNTNHHEFVVEPDAFEESLQSVLRHYDEPFGDSAAIPTGHVARCARERVKMVLTGDGGDEVLSGYTIYQGEKFAARYQGLPRCLQRSIPAAARKLRHPLRGGLRYRLNRIAEVCTSASEPFNARLTSKVASLPPAEIATLLGNTNKLWKFDDFLSDTMRDCSFRDPFYRLMYYQFRVSLPDQMLTKVDRMSMAHSLETRLPFLDHRLIELMAQVHKDVKMPGLQRKSVLRNSAARQLPAALLTARKRGFVVPLREWFKAEALKTKLEDLQLGNLGLQPVPLRQMVRANSSGAADYGNFIWMLVVLNRWHQQAA